jgi:predicted transcriptional regulator
VSESVQSHARCRRSLASEIDTLPVHLLKDEIDRGLADLAEGRVQDFDVARIVARGRKRLAVRASSKLCEPLCKNHD